MLSDMYEYHNLFMNAKGAAALLLLKDKSCLHCLKQ